MTFDKSNPIHIKKRMLRYFSKNITDLEGLVNEFYPNATFKDIDNVLSELSNKLTSSKYRHKDILKPRQRKKVINTLCSFLMQKNRLQPRSYDSVLSFALENKAYRLLTRFIRNDTAEWIEIKKDIGINHLDENEVKNIVQAYCVFFHSKYQIQSSQMIRDKFKDYVQNIYL